MKVAGAIGPAPTDESRRLLTEQLLAEVTAWSPRDLAGAFKRWHQGSLSVVHLSLLSTLEARGAQPMGVLADELDVSVASATGIVDRMEKRGLVEPTERGLKLVRLVGDHRRARFAQVLGRLNEDQLAAFLTVLHAIRSAVDEAAASPDETDRSNDDPFEAPASATAGAAR
jgi:DNA-binding MarR family transcriptional regulator